MGLFDRASGLGMQRPATATPVDGDEQAIARYRYMLRTAPPETIEQTLAGLSGDVNHAGDFDASTHDTGLDSNDDLGSTADFETGDRMDFGDAGDFDLPDTFDV